MFEKLSREYGEAFEPDNGDEFGEVEIRAKVKKETPKALCIEWGYYDAWVPKSLVRCC